MGPSWYWMPDVFESFFNDFGKKTADFYKLERLDPGYQVFFGENESICIGDSLEKFMMFLKKRKKVVVKNLENLSKLQMKTMI